MSTPPKIAAEHSRRSAGFNGRRPARWGKSVDASLNPEFAC
jgi:hypothetical protein